MLSLLGITTIWSADTTAPANPDISSWKIPNTRSNFHVFLLMGQSNMAGYGGVAAGDPYQDGDKSPVPNVLVMDGQCLINDPEAKPVEPIAWRPGAHRLHLRMDTEQFGLGIDFAREYINSHPGITVGLIPCAWGGSEIKQLSKGSPIYTNAMARVKVAQQSGIIKGVLWHQGESDSVDKPHVDAYEGKLRQLIADLRTDCGDPTLPFVIGNLAEFYGVNHNHSQRIQLINQTRGILFRVGTDTANAAFVPSTGLESADANFVHFNRNSYIEFGKRYAKAMTNLQRP